MSQRAKPGSKPYRAQLRDRLAALGFSAGAIPAKVAEHLITECQMSPRTAWRLASELSLDRAAHDYNALTGDPRAGMRGTRIWEYEQWPDRGVRPTLQALRILARVYGTTWKSLLGLADLDHLPPRDLAEYHDPDRPVAESVKLAPAAAAPSEQPADMPAGSNVLADAMTLTKTNVDDTQVDDLWSDINFLGNAYTHTSPGSILSQLAFVQDRVVALLKGRQRPKQTRELYLVNAKCCAIMAWISGDLGEYGDAHELNSAAWLYTQYADDFLARRWVRMSQSRVAFWAGNAVESARLAADAQRYNVGKRLTDAPLILAEARGWSSVQAEHRVLEAIDRWAQVENSDLEAGGEDRFFNITKDRRHYMAGTSLLAVGQADPALAEFRSARLAYDGLALEYRWDAMDAMIRIDAGRAHLRMDDLDSAAVELEPLISADVSRQPDMVRATLKTLAAELSTPRWGKATTARSMVETLLSAQSSVRHR